MAWGDGRACMPGIPQYTVDTLLWHLQGQLDWYVCEKRLWLLWSEHSEGKPQSAGNLKRLWYVVVHTRTNRFMQTVSIPFIWMSNILSIVQYNKTPYLNDPVYISEVLYSFKLWVKITWLLWIIQEQFSFLSAHGKISISYYSSL